MNGKCPKSVKNEQFWNEQETGSGTLWIGKKFIDKFFE